MDWPTATLLIALMTFAAFAVVCLCTYKFIAWLVRSATKTTKKTVSVLIYPIKR